MAVQNKFRQGGAEQGKVEAVCFEKHRSAVRGKSYHLITKGGYSETKIIKCFGSIDKW